MMHPNGKKHLPMAATCGNNEGFCSINGLEIQILYQILGAFELSKSFISSVSDFQPYMVDVCM